MNILRRMRRAMSSGRYEITHHATEEMANDGLVPEDALRIIETGETPRLYTDDPRGKRYEVAGRALDGRSAMVVVRFLPDGTLRVITAYAARSGTQ